MIINIKIAVWVFYLVYMQVETMASIDTLQLYVSKLNGRVLIIHGTSSKEATVANLLEDQLKLLNVVDSHCVTVSLKELSAAIKKARHVVLLFNCIESFTKKLRHVEEFVAQINDLRENMMLVIAKHSIMPDQGPLSNCMCLNVEDEPRELAKKCVTIFGGMYAYHTCICGTPHRTHAQYRTNTTQLPMMYVSHLKGNDLGNKLDRGCLLWYTWVLSNY